jgi:hypothetical protein
MRKTSRTITLATTALSLTLIAGRASAQIITLTFDDVTSLSQYASLGVTFSPNASIWAWGTPSVLTDPSGGPYSVPNGLQFGNAGGVLGSVFFASDVSDISIWALSGPGPDLLNAPMYVRAFDMSGVQIGEVSIDPTLQFDLLSISASAIRRLDLFSPVPNNDVWDNLTFMPVPEPEASTTCLLFGAGFAVLGLRRRAKAA